MSITIDARIIDIFITTWSDMDGKMPEWMSWQTSGGFRRSDINCGWCYQIAVVFKRIYGGEYVTPGYRHAWIRINGLDYDSDNLSGVPDLGVKWSPGEVVNEEELCDIWGERGNTGEVRMDIVEEVVRRYDEMLKSEAA